MVKLVSTQEVRIADIDISERLRPVSDLAVVSLMASLEEIGQQAEIHVRKIRHQGGRLKLIAGAHRIEAHVRLGCTSIAAKIWDCTDDWAEMAEIDDNLAHAELSPLDLSVFLARRKVVYERQHPETKADAFKGNRHTGNLASDIMSFTRSVAEQRAMSKRQIERLVAAGTALDDETIALLRQAPHRVTLSDLQTLGKCGDAADRRAVCEVLSRGEAKNAKAALEGLKAAPGKAVKNKNDTDYLKLSDVWSRSSPAARRRFLAEHREPIVKLLSDPKTGWFDES